MSYDILLLDPKTKELIQFDNIAVLLGGIYAFNSRGAWLNITFSYCRFYLQTIDKDKGIRWLYGKRAKRTIPVLKRAIKKLGTVKSSSYYDGTPGNAGAALKGLLAFAMARPDGIWSGDPQ